MIQTIHNITEELYRLFYVKHLIEEGSLNIPDPAAYEKDLYEIAAFHERYDEIRGYAHDNYKDLRAYIDDEAMTSSYQCLSLLKQNEKDLEEILTCLTAIREKYSNPS